MKSNKWLSLLLFLFLTVFILNVNTIIGIGDTEVNARQKELNESPCWGAGTVGTGRYVECPTCVRVLHYNPFGPSSTCSK